eukprot:SAG11_NODE_35442_length_266_cov_1.233533_1_plen_73_part_01
MRSIVTILLSPHGPSFWLGANFTCFAYARSFYTEQEASACAQSVAVVALSHADAAALRPLAPHLRSIDVLLPP